MFVRLFTSGIRLYQSGTIPKMQSDYSLQAHLGLERCTASLPLRLGLHGTDHLAVDQNPKTIT